jgi:hypothetical protein
LPRALCLFAPVLLLLLLFDDPVFLGQLVLRIAQQNPAPLICRIVMMCVYVSSVFGGVFLEFARFRVLVRCFVLLFGVDTCAGGLQDHLVVEKGPSHPSSRKISVCVI